MGLRRAMFKNNASKGMTFKYFDIQFVEIKKEKKWYAWYHEYVGNEVIKDLENDPAVR